jgi:Leu/Phe-tRNA-protein transferase
MFGFYLIAPLVERFFAQPFVLIDLQMHEPHADCRRSTK